MEEPRLVRDRVGASSLAIVVHLVPAATEPVVRSVVELVDPDASRRLRRFGHLERRDQLPTAVRERALEPAVVVDERAPLALAVAVAVDHDDEVESFRVASVRHGSSVLNV